MPDINDFKLLAKKAEKYGDLLLSGLVSNVNTLDIKQRERVGFYLYILENICGLQDIFDLKELVTDTDFNNMISKGPKIDDCGVDAIHIDDDEFTISLFNFKYREKFSPNKQQSVNEVFLSTKFVNAITNENIDELEGKLKTCAAAIIEKLNSSDEWKLKLYVVSNEFIELKKTDKSLTQLEQLYGLDIIPIGLVQICQYMSVRPEAVDAELLLDNDAIMSFSEDAIASSRSYITRLSIDEVIRITCSDKGLRSKYNLEDVNDLKDVDLDYSVLFDNVRGFVLRSKYNENISETLRREAAKFFMYNNGLTLIAEDIEAKPVNANKKVKLKLTAFQVLNGGQTLRTIHDFHKLDDKNIIDYLSNGQVLVRIFKTTNDEVLNNKIAEYTNSQNSISSVDLKSLRPEQIQLEQYLDEHEIVYSRKTGDIGSSSDKRYKHQISMERFGQILFSLKGNPHKASNQKKLIFEKYYDDVFGQNQLIIEESPNQISRYFQVKTSYEKMAKEESYSVSDQKIFYILYIYRNVDKPLEEIINTFEKLLEEFMPDSSEPIAPSRKLIQLGFKDYIDEKFSIGYPTVA